MRPACLKDSTSESLKRSEGGNGAGFGFGKGVEAARDVVFGKERFEFFAAKSGFEFTHGLRFHCNYIRAGAAGVERRLLLVAGAGAARYIIVTPASEGLLLFRIRGGGLILDVQRV
ncbi:MAG: hypothetical protein M3R15_19585 [Acidobacteriota bacterium]|nr:hypothetical protein [Acidobacteriota bacterium]